MSDSDRRHNCFGIVVRILSIVVLFTVAMTLVWVRSSRTTAKGSVHHSTGDVGPVALDHNGLMNATHIEQERVENDTWTAIQVPDGEQAPRHRPRAEYSRLTTRSGNDGVVFQDNRFETGPSMSKNRVPMFVIRGKLIKKIPHSIYHHRGNTSTVVDEHSNNETDTSRRILHEMNIRLNHRQINNHGYPTIQMDETVADTDLLNNNQNAYYDLTYDVNEKGSEENKNSIDRSSWTTSFNTSGQIIPERLWLLETPEISGNSDQPHFRLGTHYENTKDIEQYRFKQYDPNSNPKIPEGQLLKHIPPTYKIDFKTQPIIDAKQDNNYLTPQPPEGIPAVQNNMSSSPQPTMKDVPIINELLWRRIGIMALIKLGLVKLKVIGFIKIVYFLLFKLKFFLIVLFLKFFSLLKFIKFSSLPFLFLPLAAIILLMDINNNPGIFSAANTPIPKYNEEVMNPDGTIQFTEEIVSTPGEITDVPTGQTVLVPSSQTETVLVPSGQTVLVPSGQTVLVPSGQIETPNVPSGQTETVVVPSGQTETVVVPSGQTQASPNIPQDVIDAFNNIGKRYEPLEVMDPTLDLFQAELNSEECVERIACKIAATGKTGIIPLWINWVLHRVSKPVPNDKLLYYLKAYDDVTNEIHMKSPDPDSWETWCFERYDCNDTDTK